MVCHEQDLLGRGNGQVNLLTCEGKAGEPSRGSRKEEAALARRLGPGPGQGNLFSGGNDTRLVSYDAQSFLKHRTTCRPTARSLTFRRPRRRAQILRPSACQQLDAVEVWQIQTIDQDSASRAKLAKGRRASPGVHSQTLLLAVPSSGSNILERPFP